MSKETRFKTQFGSYKNIAKQVVPEQDSDTSHKLLNWNSEGQNNDFPQYLLRLVDHSPTVQGLISTYQQYLIGAGISSEQVADFKVNAQDTFTNILDRMTKDYAYLKGYCLKVTFKVGENGLVINTLDTIPFEATRLGINDQEYVDHVVYNPHFGTSEYKAGENKRFELFTTDQKKLISQVKKDGYKGHVLWRAYNIPGHRFYPFPPLASAKDWIGADGEIQKFHYNNIASGFLLKAILTVYGDPNAAAEEREVTKDGVTTIETVKTLAQQLQEELEETLMGTDGMQVLIQYVQDIQNAPKLETLTTEAYDNLYNELQVLITEQIARVMQIPTQLANINSNQALNVSGELLQNAVYDMHSRVQKEHEVFEQDLKMIQSLMDVEFEDWSINHYFPFPNYQHLDKFWELASTAEKIKWLQENTNFEIELTETL